MCLHARAHVVACGCAVTGSLRGSSLESAVFSNAGAEGSVVSNPAHRETGRFPLFQVELALKAATLLEIISCWRTSAVTKLRDSVNIYRLGSIMVITQQG